ncbi:MAG: hypothetical protein FWC43_10705 [Planctomycetaceae bacterium]|nr:hypothetical protein [Planctomycetaceae bacterium]
MPRKILRSLVFGILLAGGSVVLGQQQPQHQHQHAQPQNQPKPATTFFKNLFGIGEPAPVQNPPQQPQQHVHNHGPANPQQPQAQPQVQPQPQVPPQNTPQIQNNNNTYANPGAVAAVNRVPARETTFSPEAAAPRESEEATFRQLDRFRERIFEETTDSRDQMLKRRETSLVSRNGADSLETSKIASSSKVGLSTTKKSYVAEIDEEEEVVEEPIAKTKREAAPKIAVPTVSPSNERQRPAVIETVTPSQKSKAKNTVKTEPLEEEFYDEDGSVESKSVVITGEDGGEEFENDRETVIETSPRKIGGSSSKQNTSIERVPTGRLLESPIVKSNRRSGVAVLEVEMTGSQKRIVGQESPYQFTITNRGEAVAEQVVLSVELPVWAEIQSFDPKVGATSVEPKDDETNLVSWNIDRLEAGESQQLVIHLIPRQRKALTMSWDHTFKPPVSQLVVDVLEPRLEMSLEGPSEMQWGTKEMFRLRIQNTGNGDAEDVYLTLLDEQGDSETEPLGPLKAGQEKPLTIEVDANKPDKIDIVVQASGPFGLQAEAKRTVKVLRPKLVAFVEAPEMQFVDNQSEYRIVVQNTGTAQAQNVEIKAVIPSNVKYVSHQGNGRVISTLQNQVIWTVDTIPVGEEFICTLVCEMKRSGTSQVNISATERTGLSAAAVAVTQVEAIADLVLRLENPQGPVEVGKAAYHRITVTNRGSKPAENVQVIAVFAEGVTPLDVEGGKANPEMSDGQVFFDTIPVVNPKQSVVLKIKAQSSVPGKKKVRAEMICDGIDTHSIQEDSTHYYSKVKGESSPLKLNPIAPLPGKLESSLPDLEPLPEDLGEILLEDF